jgi:hypothetical protein
MIVMSKKKKDKKRRAAAIATPEHMPSVPMPDHALAQIGKIRLTAALLQLGGTYLSDDGDNPLDLRQFLPRVEDRRALMADFHEWNGTPELYDQAGEYETISDAATMLWLAHDMEQFAAHMLAVS